MNLGEYTISELFTLRAEWWIYDNPHESMMIDRYLIRKERELDAIKSDYGFPLVFAGTVLNNLSFSGKCEMHSWFDLILSEVTRDD
jgi:hypothetical protein